MCNGAKIKIKVINKKKLLWVVNPVKIKVFANVLVNYKLVEILFADWEKRKGRFVHAFKNGCI